MDGTYRKTDEDLSAIENGGLGPPPAYDSLSNGGVDNLGVRFAPSDVIQQPETKTAEPVEDDDPKKKKKEEKEKPPMAPFSKLFQFADSKDKILIFLGIVGAILHGAATPVQFIIFGRLIDSMLDFEKLLSTSGKLESMMTDLALYYVYLAIGTLIVSYLQMGMFSWSAARQTKKMRLAFFQAVMRQDIGWFDTYEAGELNNRLTDDINKVAEGLGGKVGIAIQFVTTFFAGFGIGFGFSWKLTLVILSLVPLQIIAGGIIAKVITVFTTKELDAYAKAGAIAEEVLSSIKTVAAFGGENKESERYSGNLHEAQAYGIKKGLTMGLGFGFFQLIMFGSYALAFWYGSTLVLDNDLTGGNLLLVFFSVLVGATQLGQAGPNVEAISTARGAAYELFKIIDREPPIDVSSVEGDKPTDVSGNIEFKDVHFSYPSRDDVKVLNGLNLEISAGQTVALVGESGCGKSTTIKLIQRFYDPQSGEVSIDNRNVNSWNVSWLRRFIGVVSQEPVLFATTIAENIRYGQDGISQEDIEKATKMSNAHDFIQKLPNGYETLVGERGAQLSGGQKQRIAIARALVRNPKILLLDEATSALDTESESLVQAALERASEGRTTIIIAHRLSTVKNADMIAAFEDGVIAELGSHSELIAHDGVYKQLVMLQTFESEVDQGTGNKANVDLSDVHAKESNGSVAFARSVSVLSSGSEGENEAIKRKLSLRASQRKHSVKKRDSQIDKKSKDKVVEEKVQPAPILRIMKLNNPEWPFMVVGIIAAMGNGVFPLVFALILGEMLNVFTKVNNPDEFKEESVFWSLMFLAFGGFSFFTQLLQNYMFAISGERLTTRLRQSSFKCLLKQEMAFFDDPLHSTGALTTALATHASDVKGATGARLGTIAMTITTVIGSLVYSFVNGWKLTFVVVAFVPFIVIAGILQIKTFAGDNKENSDVMEAGQVAVEAFDNIRTIATLGREETFCQKFISKLQLPYRKAVRSAHVNGICYGFMEAIMFCCNAASFRFGAYLMVQKEMNIMEVMKVVMCIVIAGMMFGHITGFSPDYVKAKIAAARIFKLFDRVSLIDSSSTEGTKPGVVQGTVQLRNVRFRYPSRQDVKVLRGVNLSIKTGQTLALVGSSGCGKSTIVSLLERFYDAESGEVALDGNDVKNLNIQWLRSKLSIVSQEPVLFGFSIAENIAYGDNSRQVSKDEIEAAAKSANIHSFINSLPKGYETLVGDKGTLISGGQKQRIAIARALIRNPRILLLDEATSALDTESERVVQEALDAARRGRTVIMIAHRLSTVKNADMIAVIHHGQVVEQGTHQELLGMNGYYAGLVSAQMINEEN